MRWQRLACRFGIDIRRFASCTIAITLNSSTGMISLVRETRIDPDKHAAGFPVAVNTPI